MRIDYRASERSSLGIEMELQIVSRETRALVDLATPVLAALPPEFGSRAKHELLECTVEVVTGVARSVAEARADLAGTIEALQAAVACRGGALLCSGTHPFSDWVDQTISPDPRYGILVERMQWPARQLQIFGVHVHVGVRSAEKAVAVAGALTAYLPHFLALSASSPYWLGQDTGLASSRTKIFEMLPTAGLPYHLESWGAFEAFMTTLIAAGAIETIRELWWDVRPHPNFGTVELRMCDGMPTLSEVCAVAALAQSLVEWMDTLYDRGFALPHPKAWIDKENKWRAARFGLDARIIVDDAGDQVLLAEAIPQLVEELHPVATRLGCGAELEGVLAILEHGPSYLRQRRVTAAGGTLADLVDCLIAELASDAPVPFRG